MRCYVANRIQECKCEKGLYRCLYRYTKYGRAMAEKIQQRIQELSAADSVETMIRFRIGRCHQLHGNRKSQYALDLVNGWRLIFEKKNGEIKIVTIQEITDYH